jgi:hypothetical protein
MFFELQLSADVFKRIVRNRLKALPLCVNRQIIDTNGTLTGVNGTFVVVDQVTIGSNTWIQREQSLTLVNKVPQYADSASQQVYIFSPTNYNNFTVPFLQVKQEVIINLVTAADLDANGPNPTPPFKTLTIYPVFNVSLDVVNAFVGKGGPLRLSYTLAYVDFGFLFFGLSTAELNEIQQFVAGVQLPPTIMDLSSLNSVLGRPVVAINAGIACDPSGSFVALRADYDVYASPVSLSKAFFEDGPPNLLGGKDWSMLIDANSIILDARTKVKAALENEAKMVLNSGPEVNWDAGNVSINITAAVELLGACPFFVDDIDMNVDVDIKATISVPQTNTLRRNFNIAGEPSNITEEIACSVTAALLWPFIGPVLLKDEDLDKGLGYYLAGLAIGPIFVFIGALVAIETKGLSKDISKDLGNNCHKVDDENYECNNILNLTMPLSSGANSRLELETVSGVSQGMVLGGTISNLRDFFLGSLELIDVKQFTWQVVGRCQGNGKHNFSITNQAKITVSGTPPAGMCYAYIIDDRENEFTLSITENQVIVKPSFKSSYLSQPYSCRIRLITNRGVRTITLHPPAELTGEGKKDLDIELLRANSSCYYWEKDFTKKEKVLWLPDPPFGDRYFHFWQIVVRGLKSNQSVRVENPDGATVVRANASRSGAAHMSMMFSQDMAPASLSLQLTGDQVNQDEQLRELSVQQILFEHQITLPIGAPIRKMMFEGAARNRRLIIVDGEKKMTWNVTSPSAAILISSTTVEENQGNPVIHSGKYIGREASSALLDAVKYLEEAHGTAEAIGNPRIGGINNALYIRTTKSTSIYEVSDPLNPKEMQNYEQGAWHEGVALGGKLMAKYNPYLGTVDIYKATSTILL